MTRKNVALCFVVALLSLSCVTAATAQIVLTEIDITGGQVELTNLSITAAATGVLEWCIPFSYGVLEDNGTAFAPGESRTYSVGAMTVGADAVWIYENRAGGGFANESEVSSGAVFGTSTVGGLRIAAVVADNGGSVWASASDFIKTTGLAAGETLQLNYPGTNANSSSSWVMAPATLGAFVPEPTSVAMLVLGLFSVAGFVRRRRA